MLTQYAGLGQTPAGFLATGFWNSIASSILRGSSLFGAERFRFTSAQSHATLARMKRLTGLSSTSVVGTETRRVSGALQRV